MKAVVPPMNTNTGWAEISIAKYYLEYSGLWSIQNISSWQEQEVAFGDHRFCLRWKAPPTEKNKPFVTAGK